MKALTSIAPRATEVDAQRARLDSWRAAGLAPASLNPPGEIEWLRGAYPGVDFVPCERLLAGRYVLVDALLDYAVSVGAPALLLNADLTVWASAAQLTAIADLATGGLPYLLQYNVGADGNAAVEPCGISAFVLTPATAAGYARSAVMALGKPWWDYWLPYAALRAGTRLLRPRQTVLLHHVHPRCGWSEADWLGGAQELASLMDDPVPADMEAGSRYSAAVYAAVAAATVLVEVA